MSTNFERMQAVTLTLPGVPPNFTNQRKYDNPFAYMELRKNWKRTVYYSATATGSGSWRWQRSGSACA